ncbi:Complex III subunit 7 [Intoshia linei]|uniref:Cytochrome b-c1 complex subunit 7 n=1 Tax=Intoshia linei TaxID=1819745 RepID=A0A177BDF6_9BILA|nr:Complex III subunit 7 [Intoshia linei]
MIKLINVVPKFLNSYRTILGRSAYILVYFKTSRKMATYRGPLSYYAKPEYDYVAYGLHVEDTYPEDDPIIAEAVRRLPSEIQDLRNFRIIRCNQLSLSKSYLPVEDQIPFNQQTPYLHEYIMEVQSEFDEIEEWKRQDKEI